MSFPCAKPSHRFPMPRPFGELEAWKARGTAVECEVLCGDAVLMCPLILHASAPAAQPVHRRVVHIEYAAADLPHRVEWYDRVRGENELSE